jgi:acyl-CoA thioesterase II
MTDATRAVERLLALLELERIDRDLFRADVGGAWPTGRLFGGQVAAQALRAAINTVDVEHHPHSMHGYFLRPGSPKTPVLLHADRIRDGRSFTTRRVVAIQHGKAIFNLSASFHIDEPGLDHQIPMPAVEAPDDLPTFQERMARFKEQMGDWYTRPRPIDLRYVGDPWRIAAEEGRSNRQQVWLRADGRLPDDPLLHVCVVAYASDMTLLDSVLLAHGVRFEDDVMVASLDHAMWFHRPFRADEWLLYDQESPSASTGRGLTEGRIFRADGTLVLSVVQEGLVRLLRP